MKTYILDVLDVNAEIRQAIRPFIGVAGDVMDLTDIVVAAFETTLFGQVVTTQKTFTQLMSDMGIPTTPANKLNDQLYAYFFGIINRMDIPAERDFVYSYRLVCDSEFVLQIAPKPPAVKDPVQEFQNALLKGISDGDWYSERLRQAAGLP